MGRSLEAEVSRMKSLKRTRPAGGGTATPSVISARPRRNHGFARARRVEPVLLLLMVLQLDWRPRRVAAFMAPRLSWRTNRPVDGAWPWPDGGSSRIWQPFQHQRRKYSLLSSVEGDTETLPNLSSLGSVVPIDDRSGMGRVANDTDAAAPSRNGATAPSQPSSPASRPVPDYEASVLSVLQVPDDDIARPTENGGYSHTTASRAKISAANRGKVPWNKGRERSPEERARIAEGVRVRNRQRLLDKLRAMGVTEEEYEAQKRAEAERVRQEKLARRTERGGYTPTEETRQKISRILKQKHANNEVKPRSVDPSKVRRGFSQSEETRRKISESLRKRWANDEAYREKIISKATNTNNNEETRKKISETLRERWQDEAFRAAMMAKRANRTRPTGMRLNDSHRQKISEAMKAKWQDNTYRSKTLQSIAERKKIMAASRPRRLPAEPRARRPRPPKVIVAQILQPLTKSRRSLPLYMLMDVNTTVTGTDAATKAEEEGTVTSGTPTVARPAADASRRGRPKGPTTKTNAPKPSTAKLKDTEAGAPAPKSRGGRKKADGDVNQLKESRRDLFDLLYGDERASGRFEDEDLDEFDPYGLEKKDG